VCKVSSAAVSAAFVIAVSIAACFVLTASLCVVIALGIAVDFSAFLVIYQSVSLRILFTCNLIALIKIVLSPSVLTVLVSAPAGALPASISD
jgi:hypothetical protein